MKKFVVTMLLVVLVACSLVAVLVGCGKTADSEAVTFYYYTVGNAGLTAQLNQKLADFTAKTGIKVQPIGIAKDNYNSAISTKFTSKKTDMDVLYLDQPRLAQYASSNLIYALDEYVTTDSTDSETVEQGDKVLFNKNAFNASAWETTVYNGSTYAIPLTLNTSVLFYNVKTVTEALGLTDEQAAVARMETIKTWADVDKLVADIKAKHGDSAFSSKYALLNGLGESGYLGWYSQCFIASAGGKMYDPQSKVVLPDEDGTATEGLTKLKEWMDLSPKSIYNTNTAFTGTVSEPAGSVIFSLADSSAIEKFNVNYTDFYAIQFPGKTTEIGSKSNIGGENLVIASKSVKKAEAVKLIQYLVSEDCMSLIQACTKNFAAVTKYASLDTVVNAVFDNPKDSVKKMYATIQSQLATAQVRPVVNGWMQVNDTTIPGALKTMIEASGNTAELVAAALATIRSGAGAFIK